MNRLAIFDCDGTLVDSGAAIVRAVAETFGEHGVAVPPPSDCRHVIGLGLAEAIATLAPGSTPDEHRRLTQSYKANFFRARAEGRVEEPLFDGIADLLDALEGDGWLLGVATGKSARGLNHCLESHGIHARFISLQTGDLHPSKPHPAMALQAMADAGAAPGTTIVIGDTSYDMGMACAVGAVGIGAGWGYHDAHELLAGGAAAVADRPGDVMALIAEARDHEDAR